ncbi:hypothetical protein HA47_05705 [Pantoea stewartii subsp. indologenes]|nr:hypothetical protein HA47_05705 [Pantoea stewartii subsp. indologenes]
MARLDRGDISFRLNIHSDPLPLLKTRQSGPGNLSSCGHLPAVFRTLVTGSGAVLAMVMSVLTTFIAAPLTDLRAELTKR